MKLPLFIFFFKILSLAYLAVMIIIVFRSWIYGLADNLIPLMWLQLIFAVMFVIVSYIIDNIYKELKRHRQA